MVVPQISNTFSTVLTLVMMTAFDRKVTKSISSSATFLFVVLISSSADIRRRWDWREVLGGRILKLTSREWGWGK